MQVAGSFTIDKAILAELGDAFGTKTQAATLRRVIVIAQTMVGHTDANGVLTLVLPGGALERFQLRD